jgi:hypothetical protein
VAPLLTFGLRGAALAFREPRLYRASTRSVVSRSLSWFLSLSRCAPTRASASLTRCFSLVISSKVDILIPRERDEVAPQDLDAIDAEIALRGLAGGK